MRLSQNGGGDDGTTIELTPLIDVVFQLLIFFMITMTFQKNNEYLLPVDLAQVQSGGEAKDEVFEGLTITVSKDGNVLVNGKEPLTTEQLRTRLRETYAVNPYAQILLRGDEKATHGGVLEVLDTVKLVGFARVDMVVTRFEDQ
ncbi:MAG: biopolymer transporter ExbD [Myxococcales bacterium FL481]|nr:MAG: biopolymer transporter ExbD [Myxococcales bacterium FL481]